MILYDLVNRHHTHFSPNSWRVRMALAHKGLSHEVRDVRFGDIPGLASGEDKLTIPTIEHAGRKITDSWAIVQYLDQAFPDTPRLIAAGAEGHVLHFFQYWVQTTVHSGISHLILLDVHNSLHPSDHAYFRSSREKMNRKTLEEVQAGREERVEAFRKSLQPLRMALAQGPFVCGEQPGYADYLAFGGFQWARLSSSFPLLAQDDVLHAWFMRCLDLYDGLGRKEAAAS
ncbi:MAG: glutathione S-transferase family protein [Gammaproteobacteria bacterium]|nr:glutathione S-transferase family protein [Gammaproteobacteria bacterium]MBU0787961.1 glutathione S-transferase family protein [Gammaproteobacteria bacterium]MBU0815541.1 glutathione S-transferase family protein [Gammaproteobacteria bacterium]MBU1785351.1 glutathione S-transferase family protein [Gammaproteobacteria bacterium]